MPIDAVDRKKIEEVHLPKPHAKQAEYINCTAKRIVLKAGRRGGKTVSSGIKAVENFMKGRRQLYAAPTQEQVGRFWYVVTTALYWQIRAKIFRKNESEKFIERVGTEQRIKAKTAWNADTLRGDYADDLFFDEWQLMNEDAWGLVGAPMMADKDGNATFIYTPPSLHSRSISKANDAQHAAKLFNKAKRLQESGDPRWAAFHFTSMDNPYISQKALRELSGDMSALAYRMEIMAEDIDEAPGALWTRKTIDDYRLYEGPKEYDRIVVAIDPSTTKRGDECGIVVCGKKGKQGFILADRSIQGSPLVWAKEAIKAYKEFEADKMIAESNQGGEMVEITLHQVEKNIPVKLIHASRGKQTRAEPISALYEKGRVHHIGNFNKLEDELCLAGKSKITTLGGMKCIKDIKVGEIVLTRRGWKAVLWAGKTGRVESLLKIKTDKSFLFVTHNHPLFKKGHEFVKAADLKANDILETNIWHTNRLNFTSMASRLFLKICAGLLQKMGIIKTDMVNYSIEKYGKSIMVKFQKILTYIIGMVINSIFLLRILNWRQGNITSHIIRGTNGVQLKERNCLNLEKRYGKLLNRIKLFVKNVAMFLRVERQMQSIAIEGVAEDIIQKITTVNKKTDVYNLKVEGCPEFYANGILVHNCLWLPGDDSPNRLDAMVHGMTELIAGVGQGFDWADFVGD